MSRILKTVVFLLLLVFIGLRHEVGTDWGNYLARYRIIESEGISVSLSAIVLTDFGYDLFNWLSSLLGLGIYGVNTLCGFLFLVGLFSLLERLGDDREFYLGLLISYPYLIMVVANGYTRQASALGLVMLSYTYLLRLSQWKALFFQLLAIFFHKSSVIGFAAFFFGKLGKRKLFQLAMLMGIVAATAFGLEPVFRRFYEFYVVNPMVSEGGTLRALMNIVPSLVYILLRRHFRKKYADGDFWFMFSLVALLLGLPSLFKFTFADRLLLYFSPIQFVSLTRLPSIVQEYEFKGLILLETLFIYALSMFVWLLFAVHASDWLPYKNLIMLKPGR